MLLDLISHVAIGEVDLIVDSMTYPSEFFFLFCAFYSRKSITIAVLWLSIERKYLFQEAFCVAFASESRASDSDCTILKLSISLALPGALKKLAIFSLVPFDFSDFESPRDHNRAQ